MREQTRSRIPKWPFLLGDACLLGVAAFLIFRSGSRLDLWQMVTCSAAVALGAWFCVMPFLEEYRASIRLAEADSLQTALAQIKTLETVANQISGATSQWQIAQENADKTVTAADGIASRMATEAKAFVQFLEKANDAEKAALRLEVEKLHRAESDWLQIVIRILDHVHALYVAAVRSGQANLIEQLRQFANACRDAARRIGVVPFAAEPNEQFDPKQHQLVDPDAVPAAGSRIAQTIATGYSFQGQLIRRALVAVQETPPETQATPSEDSQASHLAETIAEAAEGNLDSSRMRAGGDSPSDSAAGP